jgi:hypothetical protein
MSALNAARPSGVVSADNGASGLRITVVGVASRVLGKFRDVWGRWRESRRQYQIERALYKAGGNPTGPSDGS